jgi:hypothetical protein
LTNWIDHFSRAVAISRQAMRTHGTHTLEEQKLSPQQSVLELQEPKAELQHRLPSHARLPQHSPAEEQLPPRLTQHSLPLQLPLQHSAWALQELPIERQHEPPTD